MCLDRMVNKWLAITVSIFSLCALGAFAIYTYSWGDDAPELDAPAAIEADATQDAVQTVPDDPQDVLPRLSDLSTGWSEHAAPKDLIRATSTRGYELGDVFHRCPGVPEGSAASAEFWFGPRAGDGFVQKVVQTSHVYLTEADAQEVEEGLTMNPQCVARAIRADWDTTTVDLVEYGADEVPWRAAVPSLGDASASFSEWFWMTEESAAYRAAQSDLLFSGVGVQWVVVRAGRLVTLLSFEAFGSVPDPLVIEEFMGLLSSRIGVRGVPA